jgi:NADP-dependent 3-hydroxy acid dehydrogenase YdfG
MATLAVIGAGPGLGRAIAQRFGADGFDIALVARDPVRLDALAADLGAGGLTARAYPADVTDRRALVSALQRVEAELGSIDVLVFNPANRLPALSIDEVTPEDTLRELEQKVLGAVTAVGAVLPGMRQRGHGSLLFTVGSSALYPVPAIGAVGVAASGLRAYALSLHQALAAEGITVGLAVIDLFIKPGDGEADPDSIAERIHRLHVDRNPPEVKIGSLRDPGNSAAT